MGKILLGIVIGSAATSAVFVLLVNRSLERSSEDAEASVRTVNVEATNVRDSAVSIETADPSRENPVRIQSSRPSAQSAEERLTDAIQLLQDAQAEFAEAAKNQALAELGPVVNPLPLSPEFDWLGEDDVFIERMEREAIDPLWAGSAEAQLWDYLGSRPRIAERYGTPTVRCHSVRCQLTWMSYSSSETEAVVRSDMLALRDGLDEYVPGAFDCGLCPVMVNVQDGRTTVFLGLTRTEE